MLASLKNIEISIIIPCKDEADSVDTLYREVCETVQKLQKPFEIIFVNDGSTDATESNLRKIALADHRVRIINFRRNFGQTAAMSAGFSAARGGIIVAMDGDLQNDPNDVPRLIAKLNEGYDLVSGWRKDRKDNLFYRTIPSKIANWMIAKIIKTQLHDYGCSLKAYRKEVLQHIRIQGEMHRFIPALMSQVGAKITEIPVNHRQRQYGQTKYSLSRTFRVVLDLLTVKFLNQFSTRPLHFIGIPGTFFFVGGTLLAFYLTIERLVFGGSLANRPILILAVLLMVVGTQFIALGLIAELVTRLYYSMGNNQIYVIRSEIVDGIEAHAR